VAISAQLSTWGINSNTQVVVYDHLGGAYASRLWWLLRFLGHNAAAILDGGLPAWQQAGYPLASGAESRPQASFRPEPNWDMLVTSADVERLRIDPAYRLIDARAAERFRGDSEPIDPVAGHIPGAVNRFHGENLSSDGSFLSAGELRRQFNDLLGSLPPANAVVYCGSGVTSCHHLVAMEHAGLPGARLYLGSWSEWITDRKRPVS
jgi:thiosulfate/3-mercaptopyruvate sulfurtransferase